MQFTYYTRRQIIHCSARDIAFYEHIRAKLRIIFNQRPLLIPEKELFKRNYLPSKTAKIRGNPLHVLDIRVDCVSPRWPNPHPSYSLLYAFVSRVWASPANADDSVILPISHTAHAIMNTEFLSPGVWIAGVSSAINEYFFNCQFVWPLGFNSGCGV